MNVPTFALPRCCLSSFWTSLVVASVALNLSAVVPEHTVTQGAVRLSGVGPDNPILYDNDWWFDVFDNNYLFIHSPRI